MIKRIISIIIILFPWRIRRWCLIKFWKYEIHPSAKIGFSYIYPRKLIMKSNSSIGHLNVAIHLDLVKLDCSATISRSNWITGFPNGTNSRHFEHQKDRKAQLIIGFHSAITKNHHFDCTNSIEIGNFVTIAGYQSQFLTHSIDVYDNRQDSKAIKIGDYTFLGTNTIVLGGSKLPSYSVLGAKSLLNKAFEEEWKLYAGVPAKAMSDISKEAKYFSRIIGFVD